MNVRHPAPDELLLDYTVGATGPGKSLLVACHLSMCDEARRRFQLMEQIGGAVLESIGPDPLERVTADRVLDALGTAGAVVERPPRARPAARPVEIEGITLPAPLAVYADMIADRGSWRRLGRGVEAAELPVSTPTGKTQLLRAAPGIRIFEHTHMGEEAVLLLKGAFHDNGERFAAGDVAVNDGATTHSPVIDDQEVCLCLAVTEGPIRFVGPAGWLLNLFNRF